MVNLTQLRLARLLDRKDNIRNIFIFAPSCQAKSYITNALVSAAGVIAPRVTADVTNMNDPSGAVKECGQSAHSDGDKQSSHTDGIVSDTAAGDESDALVSDTTATHDYTSGMAIAHSGVDKQSSHSDGIVSDPAPGAVSDALVSDTHAANSEMAIYYEMTKHYLPCNGEARSNRFLLNLIDSPQILDSSTEFIADISIADGALIVVDCNEGVTVNMEAFLRQVLLESIIPVLSLDLMDERLLDSEEDDGYDVGGEQVYGNLLSIIKNANKIISSYENKLLPDVKFYPEKGNVAFSCCSSRWGFTLDDFANFWAPGLGVRHSDMLEKLWGYHFYDTKTKEWTRQHTGARTCHRGFVYFCYKTILHIKECCLKGDTKMLNRILGDVVSTEPGDKELVGNALVKHVMQAWLPAGTALLDMMILKLPSPLRAQRYRVEHLYQGPLNDVYANAIRTCDPGGPLMMYVYKVAPADEKGKLIAFGRIFSGTLQSGLKVHVMGPIVPGQKKKACCEEFREFFCMDWKGTRAS